MAAFTIFGKKAYVISNPEMIKEILISRARNFRKSRGLQLARSIIGDGLLTSERDFRRQQKKMAAPAFAGQRLSKYGLQMLDLAYSHRQTVPSEKFDVNKSMMKLTLDIVNRTLFDADVSSDAPKVAGALEVVLNSMDRILNPFAEILSKLPVHPH